VFALGRFKKLSLGTKASSQTAIDDMDSC